MKIWRIVAMLMISATTNAAQTKMYVIWTLKNVSIKSVRANKEFGLICKWKVCTKFDLLSKICMTDVPKKQIV